LFTISASFFSVSALVVALMASPAAALELFRLPQCHAHFAATGFMGLLWLAVRFGSWSYAMLRALDIGSTFLICLCFTFMYTGVAPASRPELVLLLTMNFVLVTRAATVPSTWQLSLLVGVPSVAPTIVVSALLQPEIHAETLARTSAVVYAATWAGVALVTSTMISRAIYGLSRQVAEARQVGQYTLEECVGKGGMGEVYRARHALLRRPTAVKLLRAGSESDPNIERFEREVQLTSQLRHANTVAIYDYGRTLGGIFYYAMEFLDGIDLGDLVEIAGPQPPGRVIRILRQACGALEEAHAAGLIHRDVKPANIFLCEKHGDYDVAKVVDFGLVKEVDAGAGPSISRTSVLIGTPMFMAPEAIVSPDEASAKSDLYGLGCVAYYLLTGTHVFNADSTLAICSKHLHAIPEAPSERLDKPLVAGLDAAVLACLAKEPSARPASAASLAEMLAALGEIPWTASDAESWWRSQRPRVESHRRARARQLGSDASETVAVNLTHRLSAL
jgi:serine/threonine protein kinase